MPTYNQIPGEPEVWLVGNQAYFVYVYNIPGIRGEIPVAYRVSQEDLATLATGGVSYDKRLTADQFDQVGALDFGSYHGLAEFEFDPIQEWMNVYETEAQVRPWLKNAEMAATWLGAYLKGRDPTAAELEVTRWWQNHSKGQRDWLLLSMSDPATAAQLQGDSRIQTQAMMVAAGINDPDRDLVRWMSNRFVRGDWTSTYLEQQITRLSDPHAQGRLDKELRQFLGGRKVDRTMAQEDRVRELSDMWLGPRYGRMSNATLKEWAGKLRNDPDAEQQFIKQLQQKRLTLFPEYTDPNTTYDQIAGLWRGDWMDTLGEAPDEVNDLRWRNVIRTNDAEEVGRRIYQIGIDRGSTAVKRHAVQGALSAFGQVRNAI